MFFDTFVLREAHEKVRSFACDDDVRSADDMQDRGVDHDGGISVHDTGC